MAAKPRKPRQQRRLDTERKLREAVEALILERGIEALGVNAVAARAGVDKALIYRYFGGLEGLIRAYADGADFWPTLDEVLGPEREVLALEDPGQIGAEILRRHTDAIRSRPLTLEILARECVQRGPLTTMLEEVRERRAHELFAELRAAGHAIGETEQAVAALLTGAVHYFAIRARFIRTFGGVDLGTDEGWETLQRLIAAIFTAMSERR